MAEQAVRSSSDAVDPQPGGNRWRTVDIVVTAVLGVAFGVVFWAWNLVFGVLAAPLDFFPPLAAISSANRPAPALRTTSGASTAGSSQTPYMNAWPGGKATNAVPTAGIR